MISCMEQHAEQHYGLTIPVDHPLRCIKRRADTQLSQIRPLMEKLIARHGMLTIPPAHLIKATLIQALYSIPYDRQLCEQISYNALFRWFLDLPPRGAMWNLPAFSHERHNWVQQILLSNFFRNGFHRTIQEITRDKDHFNPDWGLIERECKMSTH